MIEYLKQLATTVETAAAQQTSASTTTTTGPKLDFNTLLKEYAREISSLETLDFLPDKRHDFVVALSRLRFWASTTSVNPKESVAVVKEIAALLDSYGGAGSQAVVRSFAFVANADIREICERDYRELSTKAYPDGSWKSAVILSGSILEAVLFDQLTQPARLAATMAATNAPKKARGVVRDIMNDTYEDEWSLNKMIIVACELGILPANYEQSIHVVLREYRNFVHPRVELKAARFVTEGHAKTSFGMLDVVLDHLTP